MKETSNQQQPASPKTSWLLAVMGVIQLILGLIALSIPVATGAASMLILGILFIAGALLSLYQTFAVHVSRIWHLVAAVLYAIVGVYILQNLQLALVSVTFLIGWLFIAGGLLRLLVSYKMKNTKGNTWRVFNGLITLLLGIMVIYQWPLSSSWLIGTLIAIELIFSGWATIFFATAVRKPNP